jgi:aldose 1-epimerase
MTTPPSGKQFEISTGNQRATIVEVGGGIREYEVAGRPVLDPYAVEAMSDGAHGAPLIPWPNRLADGRYSFDGDDHRVALTEPEKQNAIHGFVRWRSWTAVEHETARLVMANRLLPLEGYPFALDLRVAYELGEGGLTVSTTARNIGDLPCPYGHGQHPYLSPGNRSLVDDCELEIVADTRVVTDPARKLPTGLTAVEGSAFDFREPRRMGGLKIDDAFTDLARDLSGRAWCRLTAPDGSRAELWIDDSYRYLELYTGDTLSSDRARRGLGTEPMTCPPNAFASGEAVIRLDPGEERTTVWGARLS